MIQELTTIMGNKEILKAFGRRIKDLRKQKGWTQKELAAKIDVRFAQLNKYECGLHVPPLEKIIQLAETFDITVDYLLTGDRSEEKPLHNLRLLERFQAMEDFQADDQEAVIKLIDAMIIKNRVEGAMSPFEQQAG
ncbi:MAG: helix-turn-helix transcriptional regulator [Thermodesulfobacteriota bacterium]|nr:helix-turn-helix transcriptional regulator [Thermodesulfobacteriota bacterium]